MKNSKVIKTKIKLNNILKKIIQINKRNETHKIFTENCIQI